MAGKDLRAVLVRSADQDLISPLFECEGSEGMRDELIPPDFREDLRDRVGKIVAAGQVHRLAVYFRDLDNGPWFGVRDNEDFYPASLLKLPVAMAVLKQAEEEPRLLDRSVACLPGADLNRGAVFGPRRRIAPGRRYRPEELIELSLAESDNNAVHLLATRVADRDVLKRTFSDLGVRPPVNAPVDYLSVREYATFFRILYNASYLNKAASERLLEIMSRSSFRSGLASGVPEQIRIAHKHGEQRLGRHGEIKELHDCGIVYYPGNPYLLCIMTKGDTFEKDASVIADVSRYVFEAVDAHQRKPRPGQDLRRER